MEKSTSKYKNVAAYIADQRKEVRPLLKKMQQVIKKAAPKANEVIWYSMPTYKQADQKTGYPIVCFGAGKHHIGFYPMTAAIRKFKPEILKNKYKWSIGAVQFPCDRPLPVSLIQKIVRFRIALAKEMVTKKAKKK